MRAPLLWAAALAAAGCGNDGAGEAANGTVTDPGEVARDLASVVVRPGLWEVASAVVEARQPGLPVELANRIRGPRAAVRHCITPEQAARPDAAFLAGRRSGQCSYRDFAMQDGRIGGAMTCRDPGGAETRARMSGRYGPERFEMRMDMETPGIGAGTLAVVVRQSGRRIGDCPAGEGGTKQ
jgi:hypothetical protein